MDEKCEWCQARLKRTKFTAMVDKSEAILCQECFFDHLKGGSSKLMRRISGIID